MNKRNEDGTFLKVNVGVPLSPPEEFFPLHVCINPSEPYGSYKVHASGPSGSKTALIQSGKNVASCKPRGPFPSQHLLKHTASSAAKVVGAESCTESFTSSGPRVSTPSEHLLRATRSTFAKQKCPETPPSPQPFVTQRISTPSSHLCADTASTLAKKRSPWDQIPSPEVLPARRISSPSNQLLRHTAASEAKVVCPFHTPQKESPGSSRTVACPSEHLLQATTSSKAKRVDSKPFHTAISPIMESPPSPIGSPELQHIREDVVINQTLKSIIKEHLRNLEVEMEKIEGRERSFHHDEGGNWILKHKGGKARTLRQLKDVLSIIKYIHKTCTKTQYKKFLDLYKVTNKVLPFVQALIEVTHRDLQLLEMALKKYECIAGGMDPEDLETQCIFIMGDNLRGLERFYQKILRKLEMFVLLGDSSQVVVYLVSDGEKLLARLQETGKKIFSAYFSLEELIEDAE